MITLADNGIAATEFQSDAENLARFHSRLDLIRDRVRGVALGYQNGAYLTGFPGTGKTKATIDALEEVKAHYILRNGRISPAGLYETLEMNRESVIVIDDVPQLLTNPTGQQILLATLGGEIGQPRHVTYTTKRLDERGKSFEFCGGIIAISNVPLRRDPASDALASRMVLVQHEPTADELAAVMREAAERGYKTLTRDECREVVDFILDECRTQEYRVDLRLLYKGLEDRRMSKDGLASRQWQELIRSSMKQIFRPAPRSKQEELEEDRERVRQAMRLYPKDTKAQIKYTGLSRTKFYTLRRSVDQ